MFFSKKDCESFEVNTIKILTEMLPEMSSIPMLHTFNNIEAFILTKYFVPMKICWWVCIKK